MMSIRIYLCFLLFLIHINLNNTESNFDLKSLFTQPLINFNKFTIIITAKLHEKNDTSNESFSKIFNLYDASTKVPNGILVGDFFDLGNFDECYNTQFKEDYGKYCLGVLPLSALANSVSDAQYTNQTLQVSSKSSNKRSTMIGPGYVGLSFAICGLSSMTIDEFESISPNLNFLESRCYSQAAEQEKKLTFGAIATITFLAVLIGIAFVQTVYDLVLYYTNSKPFNELCLAFSFFSNGKKLISYSNNSQQLPCLNGIKTISMFWVFIGHELTNILNAPLANSQYFLVDFPKKVAHMYLFGATLAVDTFLCVGGLVTVYAYLSAMKKGVEFNVIKYYLHRFLRLTPAFGMVIVFHITLVPYLPKGPLSFYTETQLVEACRDGWWKTLFYMNNFFYDSQCVMQSWYLSVDFQLFLLSPIVLLPMIKFPKFAKNLLVLLIIAGCAVPFSLAWIYEFGNLTDEHFLRDYYMQTHARFGPYVIGMAAGWIIYYYKQQKLKPTLPYQMVSALWLFSLSVLFICVFASHDIFVNTKPPQLDNSFYLGFHRQSWSLAITIIIVLCVFGHGQPINTFLSCHIFQIITKLSYSIYLIHYSFILIRNTLMTESIKLSNFFLAQLFWGDFMVVLVLAFVFCLLFESPVICIEKYIFSKSIRSIKSKKSVI